MKNNTGKSILIIDTPKKCIDCPCYASDFLANYCHAVKDYQEGCHPSRIICKSHEYCVPIPTWCPLTLLPERKDLLQLQTATLAEEILKYQYAQGYNDCLSDIQKGKK